jgi:type I restriction enzyme S subunit
MTSWVTKRLGEFVSLQRGHDLTEPERRPGEVPVMGSAGPNGTHDRALASGPGVVIGRSGASFGQVHFVTDDYWPHNTCLYVTDFQGSDPKFAYYLLKTIRFEGHNSGSAQPSLNRNFIYPIPVTVPEDIDDQRAIAHVLGTLDDKIELNRHISRTLEAIAQAIYKAWFVDFEHDWPADGWSTKPLDVVADFLNGLALQKYAAIDGEDSLPVIKIAQLRAGHTKTADRAGTNVPEPYVINDGDLLFSWSGSLEVDFWCGGRGALNQHLFKVTSQVAPLWFAYLWTKHHLPEFRAIAANKATTMGHIQRKHLTAAEVLLPPPVVLEAMDKVMQPIINQMIQLRLEARTLAEQRDELLPKLMSGELQPDEGAVAA